MLRPERSGRKEVAASIGGRLIRQGSGLRLGSTILIAVALAALSACAYETPTRTACVVARESGFIGAGGGEERITVAQNGSPCVMATSVRGGSMGRGQITLPPAHGTASVRVAAEATLISYTPAPDYVGADSFTVNFGPDFDVKVTGSGRSDRALISPHWCVGSPAVLEGGAPDGRLST